MNIIITGSNTGFLGSNFRKQFKNKHNFYCISSYYRYRLEKLKIEENKWNILINFGWIEGSNFKDLNSINQFNNINLCINLFNWAVNIGVKKIIGIGSSWENFYILNPNDYAFCKIKVREIWEQMAKIYGIQLIWIVPYWMYGPGDKDNRFIPKIINLCLNNKQIELHPAQNKIDYLFIDDLNNGLDVILEKANNNNKLSLLSYNICLGMGYKIKDIVEKIKLYTNSKSEITYNLPYPDNYITKWIGNNYNLKNLGWEPRINIDKGLKKTIEWYLQTK